MLFELHLYPTYLVKFYQAQAFLIGCCCVYGYKDL